MLGVESIDLFETKFPQPNTISYLLFKIEEYYFQNGDFITKKVEKIDAKKLLEGSTRIINPESLTTFKIGLTEKEKEARSQLILPYLPK